MASLRSPWRAIGACAFVGEDLMTSTALDAAPNRRAETLSRAEALGRLKFFDNSFRNMTSAAALVVLVLLLGVAISLFIGAWPAFREFGIGFFFSDSWSPPKERFGAEAAIYGTV